MLQQPVVLQRLLRLVPTAPAQELHTWSTATRRISNAAKADLSCSPYRSEPYDPYIPGGNASREPPCCPPSSACTEADRVAVLSRPSFTENPSGAPQAGGSKTAAIQAQIDDTVGIMRENITKVAERGERLDALQDKTGACLLLERRSALRADL